ncbi:tetratricopeptide repeat protein [Aquisalibacillus elongatus]|uniref:Tetratricopeptide repeat protein n=1 Tax=Aquisalibacillus elongatus TaxID=485577 RepID=A0A3N5B7Y6_9BACI|nr:hypothetical protein [Aquisalibacillus elongatus]RPF53427.1 hypothetical protein EDC24_1927 [Aquisalibacillus elongatus]
MSKDWKDLFNKAIRLHDQAIEGDDQSVTKAHQLLKDIRVQQPNNSLIEAYYGSTIALLGRNEDLDPIQRIEYAEEGLDILDKIVAQSPDNEDIRTIRGYVCFKIPEDIFGRTETAINDFQYLINEYEKNNIQLKRGFYEKLLLDLGFAYQNIGKNKKALKSWKKLLESSIESEKYQQLLQDEGVDLSQL